MPKNSPWHAVISTMHHNNPNCKTGGSIRCEKLRQGTGRKPLCSECASLNRQRPVAQPRGSASKVSSQLRTGRLAVDDWIASP